MKFIKLLSIFFIIFCSCKKEKKDVLNRFKFEYKIINNGDKNVSRITLYASTAYPFEKEVFVKSFGKNILTNDNKEFLKYYDSLVYIPEVDVYKSCIIYLQVRVGHFNPFLGYENIKKYTILDTIKSDNQNQLRIVWPNDSALFLDE
jgi:hypothetical protein